MVCTCMQSCSALHTPSSGYAARLRSLDCRRTHGVYSVRLLQQQNLIKVAAEVGQAGPRILAFIIATPLPLMLDTQ